jgi:dipeptidyl aminopeptidase/acylaminoacyl peptidase
MRGFSFEDLQGFDNITPTTVLEDWFFFVCPSFRSEPLYADTLGQWQSGGEPSVWDWDVDDTMCLLTGILNLGLNIDSGKIVAYGHSRGGAVATLLAIRDQRIVRTVEVSGPENLMLHYIKGESEKYANNGNPPNNLLIGYIAATIIDPFMDGEIGLHQARKLLIRRSPAFFVHCNMSPIEIHHGGADQVVRVEHAEFLSGELVNLVGGPYWYYYRYPNGTHDRTTLIGCGAKIESFIIGIY